MLVLLELYPLDRMPVLQILPARTRKHRPFGELLNAFYQRFLGTLKATILRQRLDIGSQLQRIAFSAFQCRTKKPSIKLIGGF